MKKPVIPLALPVCAGLALLSVIINFYLGLSYSTILIYAAGSLFFGLLVNIRIDSASNIDYAASGELTGSLLILTIVPNLFNMSPSALFVIFFLFIFFFDFVTNSIFSKADNERFTAGLILNTILAVSCIFFIIVRHNTAQAGFLDYLSGFFNTANLRIKFIALIYLAFAALLIIFILSRPEFRLRAQGKLFFAAAGLNNKMFRTMAYLLQSAVSVFATFCAGLFAFPAFSIFTDKLFRDLKWAVIFPAIIYAQLFALFAFKVSQTAALAAAVIIIFILPLFIYAKKGIFNDSIK